MNSNVDVAREDLVAYLRQLRNEAQATASRAAEKFRAAQHAFFRLDAVIRANEARQIAVGLIPRVSHHAEGHSLVGFSRD